LKENVSFMNRLFYVLAGLLLSLPLLAQRPPETESEYDKAYQRRVQMESINGTYIPANLADAFVQLHKLIDKDSKQKFKNIAEDQAVKKLHFSFGRWIIINWGFYEGSRLSHSLKLKGLHHPDDMAHFIIRSYHRSLNKAPIDAEAQIKQLLEQREQQRLERLKQGEVLEVGKRKAA